MPRATRENTAASASTAPPAATTADPIRTRPTCSLRLTNSRSDAGTLAPGAAWPPVQDPLAPVSGQRPLGSRRENGRFHTYEYAPKFLGLKTPSLISPL